MRSGYPEVDQIPNSDSKPADTDGPRRDPADPVVAGLLEGYAQGVFPMAEPGGAVYWYDPDPRGIIPLDRPVNGGGIRIGRSLRARVRSGRFRITTDTAFDAVIRACAARRAGQDPGASWIDGRIIDAYTRLHDAGHAHSVEAWLDGTDGRPVLVGGLYGVRLGGLFAGESMFSRPDLGGTDASKVCLVWLWFHLRRLGFVVLDTQFMTDHLRSLGGVEIPRAAYHALLAAALAVDTRWAPFPSTRPE